MHSTLRFGFWYALHTMHPGFEFKTRVGTLANDTQNHLFITTFFTMACTD